MSAFGSGTVRNGHVPVTSGVPIDHHYRGLPVAGGEAGSQAFIIGTGPITHYSSGVPFNAAGEIVAENAPVARYANGMPYTASGALAYGEEDPPTSWSSGTPFTSDGKLNFGGGGLSWLPSDLFKNGEQGCWFDPSDLSTMFQDIAGTIPVTAVEQTVGRILDKSGNDNNMTAPGDTARPTLRARQNRFIQSVAFGTTSWVVNNLDVTPDYATAPDSTATAVRMMPPALTDPGGAALSCRVYQDIGAVNVGQNVTVSIYVKPVNPISRYPVVPPDGAVVQDRDVILGILGDAIASVSINLRTMEVVAGVATIEPLPDGWYRVSTTLVGTAADPNCNIFFTLANRTSGSFDPYPDGTEEIWFWGPQAVNGTDAKPYQWISTATVYDSDPALFPYYLDFNGTTNSLQTEALDLSGTDALNVFMGTRNDVIAGKLIGMYTCGTAAPYIKYEDPRYGDLRVQSTVAGSASTVVTPDNAATLDAKVTTQLAEISTDTHILRKDSVQIGASTGDLGAGTFGAANPFAFSNTAGFDKFDGGLYQLIVRGAMSDSLEIADAEAYVAKKTGVTLPVVSHS